MQRTSPRLALPGAMGPCPMGPESSSGT